MCAQDTFVALIGKAKDLFNDASKGLSAAIYTEVSDCEDELNGLFTYDRRVRMHAHLLFATHGMDGLVGRGMLPCGS